MTFNEAVKHLGIEEYSERIFKSNSHGELFHLEQYISIAETLDDPSGFSEWFAAIVKYAEENHKRPESIFQHILELLLQTVQD